MSPTTTPKVCLIGAGSSGIAAAKTLHERGIDFDCFELSDRVGGNWVWGSPTVSGRILDRLAHGAITPKPNFDRLDGDKVVVTDGTSVHADLVAFLHRVAPVVRAGAAVAS